MNQANIKLLSQHIGSYQVAHKRLKDRKRRTLKYDKLTHYQKAVVATKETIRLMAKDRRTDAGVAARFCLTTFHRAS